MSSQKNRKIMASSSISRELTEIDDEIKLIDQQLTELKQRKRKLSEKRDQLFRLIENSNDDDDSPSTKNQKWDAETFDWSTRLRELLKSTFRMDDFRELQLSVMNAVLSGEDTMLIMSTGGGKSLCYQLPAVLSDGIVLVVSPLISLMEDQVMSLEKNFHVEAAMLDSSCSSQKLTAVQNAMIDRTNGSSLKLVYVTPEKLAKSKRFVAKLEKSYEYDRLKLIAVDEVHCCSQWGHEFRLDYKFLNILKRQFPKTPILGLTATASARVIDDVKQMLNIPATLVFRAGFNRPNLFYEVRTKPSDNREFMDDLCRLINGRFGGQSGIVYCFSKKESEELTDGLRQSGIKAAFYHADVDPQRRSEVHRKWTTNDYRVIVATIAFGMGIDKPDVRFVIHHSLPKSMENYYQESGRAGRDHRSAACILYYRYADIFRQSTMVCTEKTGTENLYSIVAYCQNSRRECRRQIVARHFGETWSDDWCRGMCDVCEKAPLANRVGTNGTSTTNGAAGTSEDRPTMNPAGSNLVSDIADYYRSIRNILQSSDSKMTALKLLDTFMKSQKKSTTKSTAMTRGQAEKLIVHLLLEGYLKEDFHFTPYSIISYLAVGARSAFFKEDDTIFMTMDGEETQEDEEEAASKPPAVKKARKSGK